MQNTEAKRKDCFLFKVLSFFSMFLFFFLSLPVGVFLYLVWLPSKWEMVPK